MRHRDNIIYTPGAQILIKSRSWGANNVHGHLSTTRNKRGEVRPSPGSRCFTNLTNGRYYAPDAHSPFGDQHDGLKCFLAPAVLGGPHLMVSMHEVDDDCFWKTKTIQTSIHNWRYYVNEGGGLPIPFTLKLTSPLNMTSVNNWQKRFSYWRFTRKETYLRGQRWRTPR